VDDDDEPFDFSISDRVSMGWYQLIDACTVFDSRDVISRFYNVIRYDNLAANR
jgi:hypothetical protein